VETSDGKFPAELRESRVLTHSTEPQHSLIRLVVMEGKYRMVRRILHNSGHSVLALRRIRYGEVLLDDLEAGSCRPLTKNELQWFISKVKKSN
jgi:16S rRNA U516 pseudouridylate synthase RsuA-like enzyme